MGYEVGDKLKFLGEPHPETGELRHLGQDGTVHSLAGGPDGKHPLPVGSIGTVEAFVPKETEGAGTFDADCWVLTFPVKSAYLDDDENAQVLVGARNISFEEDQLADWFEPVVPAEESAVDSEGES